MDGDGDLDDDGAVCFICVNQHLQNTNHKPASIETRKLSYQDEDGRSNGMI